MIRKLQDLSELIPKIFEQMILRCMKPFQGLKFGGCTWTDWDTNGNVRNPWVWDSPSPVGRRDASDDLAELLQLSGLSHGTDVYWVMHKIWSWRYCHSETAIGCRGRYHGILDACKNLRWPSLLWNVRDRGWRFEEERNGYIQAMRK